VDRAASTFSYEKRGFRRAEKGGTGLAEGGGMAPLRAPLPYAILLFASALAACSSASQSETPLPGSVDTNHDDAGSSTPEDARAALDSATTHTDSGDAGAAHGDDADATPRAPTQRVVAYLPNYNGSYADWATSINFATMTHLNLAFATADSSNEWDMGASDSDVAALVTVAHAAGVKVIASLGGGGGDQTVISQYKTASNVAPLVASLDTFVSSHDFDGVDIDIEDPDNLGSTYSAFVSAVIAKMHPEGKIVTAAVAQYLQSSMHDDTLHSFDFVNVMIYSNYSDSMSALDYYANDKSVPSTMLTLGAGFFGSDSDGNEYAYSDILAADSTAWSKDEATVNGKSVSYTGMASMKELADYSKQYGGIMFWELTEDVTDSHSLYKVIQGEF
jgi:chitinase